MNQAKNQAVIFNKKYYIILIYMPYKLRKAPNRNLYWVVSKKHPKEHLSREPMEYKHALAQMRAVIIHELNANKYYK